MDLKDRELLNLLQEGLPAEDRPFLTLGNRLDISEDEVILRVEALKENGYIRRIGAVLDSRRLDYYSTLCALSVPEERIDEVAAIVNGYTGVTHNYIRNHALNMWFTLIAHSMEKAGEILGEIEAKAQVGKPQSFPAEKVYKIRTNFIMQE